LLTEESEDSFENNTLQNETLKTKKIMWHSNELFGEFKKIIPLSFNGESEEGVGAWILNMENYFSDL
jgi:hypothetical protein